METCNFLVCIIAQPNMQEMCRCNTDLAMPSNIILENKIENPRTIRERYQKPKQRIDRSVWNWIWTQRHHVHNDLVTEASLILISYFFYFISILLFPLNRKQLQEKKQFQNINANHHVHYVGERREKGFT
jgi:hypothetical protein